MNSLAIAPDVADADRSLPVASRDWRDWTLRSSAAVALCFPFNTSLPLSCFLCLVVGSLGILVTARKLPKPPTALVASAFVVSTYVFAALAGGRDVGWTLSTSTHMIQLIFAAYAFLTAFHNDAFEERRLYWYVMPVVFGHVISIAFTIFDIGAWSDDRPAFNEHNTLTFLTIFILLKKIDARRGIWPAIGLITYMTALYLLTDRASVHGLSVCVIALVFIPAPALMITALAAFLLISPVYFALTATDTQLYTMATIDYRNTFIRVEFLRSAAYLFSQHLVEHLLLGMGFATNFRTDNFNYMRDHPYLTDPISIATISNHHSVFDAYFRLGLIFGTIYLWPILSNMYINSRARAPKAGVLFLAFGLSFNAYLDNQMQVPLVCFIVAMMFSEQRTLLLRRVLT